MKGENDCCCSVLARRGDSSVSAGWIPTVSKFLALLGQPPRAQSVSQKIGGSSLAPQNQGSLFALLQSNCCSPCEQRLILSQGLSRTLCLPFSHAFRRTFCVICSSFVRLFSQELYGVQKFCFTSQCVYVQVRKFISQLSEQLKQFWPASLRFDSGFGFV